MTCFCFLNWYVCSIFYGVRACSCCWTGQDITRDEDPYWHQHKVQTVWTCKMLAIVRKVWLRNIYFDANTPMSCTQLRDIAKACWTDNASHIKNAIPWQHSQFHAIRIRRMLVFCICACFWCDVIKLYASGLILFAMLKIFLVCLNANLSVCEFACLRTH
jgi:hypothetical protein